MFWINNTQKEHNAAEKILMLCGILLFTLFCFWNFYYLPMNMDESLIYHRLACSSHPFSFWHSFRENCVDAHKLTTFWGLEINRPYAYIGPIQGLLYTPFHSLFNSPEMQYWFALLFFIPFVWLMSRETERPQRNIPLFLACLPLLVQFIHDDGVLKLIMPSFPLGAILLRKLLSSKSSLQYTYAFLLAILIFVNIFDKIFFIYLFPSFIFFCLAFSQDKNFSSLTERLHKSSSAIITLSITVALLTLILFFSTTTTGEYYLFWLMDFAKDKFSATETIKSFIIFSLYWPAYTHHIQTINLAWTHIAFAVILTALWFILCTFASIKAQRTKYQKISLRTIMLTLSFVSMLIIFLIFRNVWSAHHFIYLWIPGLMLLSDLVSRLRNHWLVSLVGFYFLLNIVTLIYLTQTPLSITASKDRDAIFNYLKNEVSDSKTIVNFSTWGGYYIYALYAPTNQIVTYIEPLNKKDALKLIEASDATERKIYNVCSAPLCNESYMNEAFSNKLTFRDALPGLKFWHVFEGTKKK